MPTRQEEYAPLFPASAHMQAPRRGGFIPWIRGQARPRIDAARDMGRQAFMGVKEMMLGEPQEPIPPYFDPRTPFRGSSGVTGSWGDDTPTEPPPGPHEQITPDMQLGTVPDPRTAWVGMDSQTGQPLFQTQDQVASEDAIRERLRTERDPQQRAKLWSQLGIGGQPSARDPATPAGQRAFAPQRDLAPEEMAQLQARQAFIQQAQSAEMAERQRHSASIAQHQGGRVFPTGPQMTMTRQERARQEQARAQQGQRQEDRQFARGMAEREMAVRERAAGQPERVEAMRGRTQRDVADTQAAMQRYGVDANSAIARERMDLDRTEIESAIQDRSLARKTERAMLPLQALMIQGQVRGMAVEQQRVMLAEALRPIMETMETMSPNQRRKFMDRVMQREEYATVRRLLSETANVGKTIDERLNAALERWDAALPRR